MCWCISSLSFSKICPWTIPNINMDKRALLIIKFGKLRAGSWYLGSAAQPLFHKLGSKWQHAVQPANTRPQNNLALFPYRRCKQGRVVQLDCGGTEIKRGDAESCSSVALRAEIWNSDLNVKIDFVFFNPELAFWPVLLKLYSKYNIHHHRTCQPGMQT